MLDRSMINRKIPRRSLALAAICSVFLILCAQAGGADRGGAANRVAAEDDASWLIANMELPQGGVLSSTEPPGAKWSLGRSAVSLEGPNLVDRTIWATVPGGRDDVLGSIGANPPAGSAPAVKGSSTAGAGATATVKFVVFEWPPVPGVLGRRWLVVEAAEGPEGTTLLRVDAQVVWVTPRAATEAVPRSAHYLTVEATSPSRNAKRKVTISAPRAVARIVRILNRLEVDQPGTYYCPELPADPPTVRLRFRTRAGGRVLAEAVQARPAGVCQPMTLSLRGVPQTPLVGGGQVLRALQAALGRR